MESLIVYWDMLKASIKKEYYACPRCNYPVNKNKCKYCGQPIKWQKNLKL